MTMAAITAKAAGVACWAARIGGTLMALLYLALIVGEGPPPVWRLSLEQNLHFLGFVALTAGLLAAWKWEGLGGAIALAGFVLVVLIDSRSAKAWITVVPAAFGLVHTICWWRLRGASPGRLPLALWVLFGLFVLLSANEVFGNPPLMTRRSPSPAVVGLWRTESGEVDAALTIGVDGAVAGRIGDAIVTGGRITANRTWFGRLLHWRSDYLLKGAASSEPFQGWIDSRGDRLDAAIAFPAKRITERVTLRRQVAP